MSDLLEEAIAFGAAAALRKRAAYQRDKDAPGITNGDGPHANVVIVASEARGALDLAADLDEIAALLEAEARI
jgi:hypothetical protein